MSTRRQIPAKGRRAIGSAQESSFGAQVIPPGKFGQDCHLFSRDLGKIRGIAEGAQRQKSKFSGRLETANWIEILFFEKEIRELVKIDNAELLCSFAHRLTEYEQFLTLSLVAEVLVETMPDQEKNDAIFRLVLLTFKALQDAEKVSLTRLYFEIWYLKLAGLFPGSRQCYGCNRNLRIESPVYFDQASPGFFCSVCARQHGILLSEDMFKLLRKILENSLEELAAYQSENALRSLMKLIDALFERSLERNFESLQLLSS